MSKLQTMRKDAGFEVMDRIDVLIEAPEIEEALKKYEDRLKTIVLADDIVYEGVLSGEGFKKEWDINGKKAVMTVKKK